MHSYSYRTSFKTMNSILISNYFKLLNNRLKNTTIIRKMLGIRNKSKTSSINMATIVFVPKELKIYRFLKGLNSAIGALKNSIQTAFGLLKRIIVSMSVLCVSWNIVYPIEKLSMFYLAGISAKLRKTKLNI